MHTQRLLSYHTEMSMFVTTYCKFAAWVVVMSKRFIQVCPYSLKHLIKISNDKTEHREKQIHAFLKGSGVK